MLVISASTAAAERGFSKLNIEKTTETLSNIMRTGIENIPATKFDSRLILKRCLKEGKRHIRCHKTKK